MSDLFSLGDGEIIFSPSRRRDLADEHIPFQKVDEARVARFLNKGRDVQHLTCETCPGPIACGAVIARVKEGGLTDEVGIIRSEYREPLRTHGVNVQDDGFPCPRELIEKAVRHTVGGEGALFDGDTLMFSEATVGETVRQTTDTLVQSLQRGRLV